MSIAENILQIQTSIAAARERRRSSTGVCDNVKLVAVTKNQPLTAIEAALEAGISSIGENRVQEAKEKYAALEQKIEWHLIGHLQTNKVRQVVPFIDLIHSVDNEKLAAEIDRVASKYDKIQEVLIQVNVAGEETKYGIAPEGMISLAKSISLLKNMRLRGLMTIAPFFPDSEMTRPIFRTMYQLFSKLRAANLPNVQPDWLSMGMTQDYAVAIEEGANLVRVGTGIFGPRQ
ncbi:Hypothetical protein LUCI_1403 [Lucifera butyrica]|uniref:Pyridoxal phosphate homeostasis protein n=1 Tax=Lucifera butyrica TaxID=1351585 RepID=A0A498R5S6_9FIRM|nr:YggS family pyridoxal phosphate-dependent enzyme [Lucifera butyrica]VBB06187.1 Hypothetical protein LUCI_1403 [Lucifera butyrica]